MFSRVNAIRPPPTNIIGMSRTIGRRVNPNVSSPLITGDPRRARLADVYPTSWRGLLLRQNPPPCPPPFAGRLGRGATRGQSCAWRAMAGSTLIETRSGIGALVSARPDRNRVAQKKGAFGSHQVA